MLPPFISAQFVEEALDELGYRTRTQRANPLCALACIDERLLAPDVPRTERARELALKDLLLELITAGLSEVRAAFDLPAPDGDPAQVTLSAAETALFHDGERRKPDLYGWSLLYYRYVCLHLDLTPAAFSAAWNMTDRNVQRYRAHGVELLRERLRAVETQARRTGRVRRLYSALPHPLAPRLVGRDDLLHAWQHFLASEPPYHIVVSGASGVGKSALVQAWVRRLIDDDALDHVLWVETPPHADAVRDLMRERLLPEASTLDVRDLVLARRVAIVLDGVSALDDAALSALLADLSGALVCILDIPYRRLTAHHLHTAVPALDAPSVTALVADLLRVRRNADYAADELAPILYERVGGIPRALAQLVGHYAVAPDEAVSGKGEIAASDAVYRGQWYSLDEALRHAWTASLLMGAGAFHVPDLAVFDVPPDTCFRLIDHHLLVRVSYGERTVVLPEAARLFLEHAEGVSAYVRDALNVLERRLATGEQQAITAALRVVDMTHWLDVSAQRRWLRLLWLAGIPHGAAAALRQTFERLFTRLEAPDLELVIAYAVCLRRLGHWRECERLLEGVARESGEGGAFTIQAAALTELAVLQRYSGRYADAERALKRAHHTARRYRDERLLRVTRLERAQIALDRGDGSGALAELEGLPVSQRAHSLRLAALLLTGDAGAATAEAHTLLTDTDDAPTRARLYTLLGRCAEEQGADPLSAYASAHSLLEQMDDPFALARAQANLAGALLTHHMRQEDEAATRETYDHAQALLEAAERIQTLLHDPVGLQVTRHNLSLLWQSFSG